MASRPRENIGGMVERTRKATYEEAHQHLDWTFFEAVESFATNQGFTEHVGVRIRESRGTVSADTLQAAYDEFLADGGEISNLSVFGYRPKGSGASSFHSLAIKAGDWHHSVSFEGLDGALVTGLKEEFAIYRLRQAQQRDRVSAGPEAAAGADGAPRVLGVDEGDLDDVNVMAVTAQPVSTVPVGVTRSRYHWLRPDPREIVNNLYATVLWLVVIAAAAALGSWAVFWR